MSNPPDPVVVSYRSVVIVDQVSTQSGNLAETRTTYDIGSTRQHLLSIPRSEAWSASQYAMGLVTLSLIAGAVLLLPVLWCFGTATGRVPQGWEWAAFALPCLAVGIWFVARNGEGMGDVVEPAMMRHARAARGLAPESKVRLRLVKDADWERFVAQLRAAP